MDKKFLGLLGVLAVIAVVALGVGWLNSSRDEAESEVTSPQQIQTSGYYAGQTQEYLDCIDAAAERLESIGVPSRDAIDQAETSPRCLPLRTKGPSLFG